MLFYSRLLEFSICGQDVEEEQNHGLLEEQKDNEEANHETTSEIEVDFASFCFGC